MRTLQQLPKQAREALDDLYTFLVTYWKLDLREQPHRLMCDAIQETETNPDRPFAMLVVPRGTYKTSIFRGTAVWKQLRRLYLHDDPYYRIAIASATLSLGRASLSVIEGQLRYNKELNEDFEEMWGTPRQHGRSSKVEDGIVWLPRMVRGERPQTPDPTWWVGSLKKISTGFHADAALVDDINNAENCATVVQREKTHDYFGRLFAIVGTEGGSMPVIWMAATPWHDDDVRGRITRVEQQREEEDQLYKSPWSILHRSAINEDGTPFFPEKYPIEKLDQIRKQPSMKASEFAANYLCDAVGKHGLVAEELIKFKPRAEFPPMARRLRVTVDPNQHNDAKVLGDYFAMVVSGYDRYANLWVLDARGSREWNTAKAIEELFRIQEDYPDADIIIEDQHMTHFAHAIQLEEGKREVKLRVFYVPSDRSVSKYYRAERLQPRFENGNIFFAAEIPPAVKTEFVEELVRGQKSRFDDFVDALAMAELGIRPKVTKDGQMNLIEKLASKKAPEWREPTFGDIPEFKRYLGPN